MERLNMSFEEKSTWVSLAIILLVFTGYFVQVFEGISAGNLDKGDITGLFFGAVITVVVLEVALHIATAIFNVKDADQSMDERDRHYAVKAGNISGWVLGIGVLTIAAHTFVQDLNPLLVANLLLFMVFVSQIASYAMKLFYYRRGY